MINKECVEGTGMTLSDIPETGGPVNVGANKTKLHDENIFTLATLNKSFQDEKQSRESGMLSITVDAQTIFAAPEVRPGRSMIYKWCVIEIGRAHV